MDSAIDFPTESARLIVLDRRVPGVALKLPGLPFSVVLKALGRVSMEALGWYRVLPV